ncbi:MAG: DUF4215 domain-containing protein [Deltaproteobacteria bacterium]|nr:DUF4215 domain-containing protein [Nannocystaceae bacterium]
MSGGFEVGLPFGSSGNRDPQGSYDADGWVAGTGVDAFGLYDANAFAVATGPQVSTLGFTNVRLQYRRWLTVEDGFFDQAGIVVDGETLWDNFRSNDQDFATFHHVDQEWRFQDVDISEQASDGAVSVGFTLASDGGLQLGGWNVDEVCVVGFDPSGAICGNAVLEGTEQCDDGNFQVGDGCSDACVAEGVTDTGEDSDSFTDDGGSDDGDTDTDTDGAGFDGDGLLGRGCGCNGSGGRDASGLLLVMLALGYRRQRGATRRRLPSCDSGTSGPSSSRSHS